MDLNSFINICSIYEKLLCECSFCQDFPCILYLLDSLVLCPDKMGRYRQKSSCHITLLFYLVNNVIVSISFIPLLSISDIFNKDMNRTFIVFIVTFLLPPIINVYSFLIPEAIPDGLMIFEVPITIKPLIIMFNIIYLGALVCCLWNKQQTFYKFYSSFLGISIIYSYLHNYIIDIYSFDIPFKDFGFRLILSLIPFVAFFLLISLNSYILIKTNKSFVNYVPNANKNQSSRKFKSEKTRNKYWY